MQAVHTRQTLMQRIVETQRRAAIARHEARRPRRPQPSYSERYRGTAYETARTTPSSTATPEPLMSRGRVFVLATGTAVVSLSVLIVSAALSA